MYKNVMAPVDFSSLETRALSVAKRLARQFDTTLHLVRVIPPPIVGQTIPANEGVRDYRAGFGRGARSMSAEAAGARSRN